MLCGRQHHTLSTVTSDLTFGNLILFIWKPGRDGKILGPLCCMGPMGRLGMEWSVVPPPAWGHVLSSTKCLSGWA